MAYSKASGKAVAKYNNKNYDQVKFVVQKGKREKIKAYAEKQGLSLNAYINKLIDKDMNQPKE